LLEHPKCCAGFWKPISVFSNGGGLFLFRKKYLFAACLHPQGNRSFLFLQGNEVEMRSVSTPIFNIALPLFSFILHGNASDVS